MDPTKETVAEYAARWLQDRKRDLRPGTCGTTPFCIPSTEGGSGKPLYNAASSRRVTAKYFRWYAVGMSPS